MMVAVVGVDRLRLMLSRVLDPEQFLSPHGIRSLSKVHQANPYVYHHQGQDVSVDYMPAESRNRMFGDTFTVPDPTGSGEPTTLGAVADDLAGRLSGIILRDGQGRRPVFGANDYFQSDPNWWDLIPFHEYFDGDGGHGIGASHQTGWTATVALLLQFGGNLRFDVLSN